MRNHSHYAGARQPNRVTFFNFSSKITLAYFVARTRSSTRCLYYFRFSSATRIFELFRLQIQGQIARARNYTLLRVLQKV